MKRIYGSSRSEELPRHGAARGDDRSRKYPLGFPLGASDFRRRRSYGRCTGERRRRKGLRQIRRSNRPRHRLSTLLHRIVVWIMRDKKFYGKYLPEGSTVDFLVSYVARSRSH